MDALEIKNNFHKLIDSIDNDNLLINFYNLLKNRSSVKDGQLWSRLTLQEQDELYFTIEECESEDNLIPNEEMKKKHKKWL
ncbi:MAG: hypothetical protein KKA81_11960 [Bacteroidetes bacterium]|nr:hypothetical protein [Bacteroidota bacterium]